MTIAILARLRSILDPRLRLIDSSVVAVEICHLSLPVRWRRAYVSAHATAYRETEIRFTANDLGAPMHEKESAAPIPEWISALREYIYLYRWCVELTLA